VALPQSITEPEMLILGKITKAQEAMVKAADWLDTARGDRDHGIAQLRVAGWTLEQIATYTGLSVAMVRKVSKKQHVVPIRTARIAEGA